MLRARAYRRAPLLRPKKKERVYSCAPKRRVGRATMKISSSTQAQAQERKKSGTRAKQAVASTLWQKNVRARTARALVCDCVRMCMFESMRHYEAAEGSNEREREKEKTHQRKPTERHRKRRTGCKGTRRRRRRVRYLCVSVCVCVFVCRSGGVEGYMSTTKKCKRRSRPEREQDGSAPGSKR